jgi:hypothetical protein
MPQSQSGSETASKVTKTEGHRVQRDRRVATRSLGPSRALSDGAGGTLRGPPA